jgi:hypothetical protein
MRNLYVILNICEICRKKLRLKENVSSKIQVFVSHLCVEAATAEGSQT